MARDQSTGEFDVCCVCILEHMKLVALCAWTSVAVSMIDVEISSEGELMQEPVADAPATKTESTRKTATLEKLEKCAMLLFGEVCLWCLME